MTYIVNDNCIACKYTDCVEVCPVDCFYEGENMLVIHPDECIDCGVCEPECPADAIRPDTESDSEKWVEFNRKYAELWPVIPAQSVVWGLKNLVIRVTFTLQKPRLFIPLLAPSLRRKGHNLLSSQPCIPQTKTTSPKS